MNRYKDRATKLSEISKEQPFEVPPHYFDDFYARLQVRLESTEEVPVVPSRRRRLFRVMKPALAMAASFALIVMLVYWPMKAFLPDYIAGKSSSINTQSEDETLRSIINTIDEQSFFTLITDLTNDDESLAINMDDEEMLNYFTAQISDYEIYLQTSN